MVDRIQNANRQYGKFCRIAAASIFRTNNPYYDEFVGFWHLPTLGDDAPSIDTLYTLLHEKPMKRWGNEPKFVDATGEGNFPEAAAATIDLQNEAVMDTNTSLRKFAKAHKPTANKIITKGQPPIADKKPVRDEADTASKRDMDHSWLTTESERKGVWKSQTLYTKKCEKCESLYTPEESVFA